MKLWKDMTNEEKGALLLAHHEGAIIEYLSFKNTWDTVPDNEPRWNDIHRYRVQPQTTTHQVWWSPSGGTVFKPSYPNHYKQLITLTLKGDECIDVKVEKL